ncbi:MAG: phosphotransferase [Phycisphaerae bacterium]|nr:phosphotransferase [Phycisphaerae bacterium]
MYTDPSGLKPELIQTVLDRYGLRADSSPRPAGGTAAPKVMFQVDGRPYLLRRRRAEFCPEPVVRFDHSVIRRLARAGLPVVEPLVRDDETTWVMVDEAAFEVFPFVEGLAMMDQDSAEQVADAGGQLGRLHRAMEGFTPEGHKYWPREFHMAANRATLADFLATPTASGVLRPVAERMLRMADRVAAALPDEEVDRLNHLIIHGDYTWANVMYRGPRVGGIFDFDWCDRHPRIHDVARGLIFFAARRAGPLDPDSIWHLVQGWTGDEAMTEMFLSGYAEQVTLTDHERRLLPAMIAETWLCCRIRAMRKVPDEQKMAILAGDIEASLDFLEGAGWPWRM